MLRREAKPEKTKKGALRSTTVFARDGDQRLWEALRARRREIAREQGVPPYVVFHDATLTEMVALRPRTIEQLSHVSGVGSRKLDAYGADFLEIILAHGEDLSTSATAAQDSAQKARAVRVSYTATHGAARPCLNLLSDSLFEKTAQNLLAWRPVFFREGMSMHLLRYSLAVLVMSCAVHAAHGQVIFQESFEGSNAYTVTNGGFDTASNGFFTTLPQSRLTLGYSLSSVDGGSYFGARNLDGFATATPHRITFSTQDVSAYQNLSLVVALSAAVISRCSITSSAGRAAEISPSVSVNSRPPSPTTVMRYPTVPRSSRSVCPRTTSSRPTKPWPSTMSASWAMRMPPCSR